MPRVLAAVYTRPRGATRHRPDDGGPVDERNSHPKDRGRSYPTERRSPEPGRPLRRHGGGHPAAVRKETVVKHVEYAFRRSAGQEPGRHHHRPVFLGRHATLSVDPVPVVLISRQRTRSLPAFRVKRALPAQWFGPAGSPRNACGKWHSSLGNRRGPSCRH